MVLGVNAAKESAFIIKNHDLNNVRATASLIQTKEFLFLISLLLCKPIRHDNQSALAGGNQEEEFLIPYPHSQNFCFKNISA